MVLTVAIVVVCTDGDIVLAGGNVVLTVAMVVVCIVPNVAFVACFPCKCWDRVSRS